MSGNVQSGAARQSHVAGFTLVELLVVIGIIAVLIGILIPALSKARQQANRTVCVSNLHQLVLGIHFYADKFKGSLPYVGPGSDLSEARVYTTSNPPPADSIVVSDSAGAVLGGWIHLGKIFGANCLPPGSGKTFYCPDQESQGAGKYNPSDWWFPYGSGIVRIHYLYRIFDDSNNPAFMPSTEWKKLSRVKLGKMKGRFSLVSDQMGVRNGKPQNAGWSHLKGWVINVGFADSHVESIQATKDIAVTIPVGFGGDQAKTNSYVWRMFRCFDAQDFSDVANRTAWPN